MLFFPLFSGLEAILWILRLLTKSIVFDMFSWNEESNLTNKERQPTSKNPIQRNNG